jgi:hypothetical protein
MPANDDPVKLGRLALLNVMRRSIDRRAPAAVIPFIDKLLGLRDRGIRSLALVHRLRRYDAHLAYALLDHLVLNAARRKPNAQDVLLDLTAARPLVSAIGYRRVRQMYEIAAQRGTSLVAAMLLSADSAAVREVSTSFLKKENQMMPDTSLGWRKTHARSPDRQKIDRLLFDRNPLVVRLLLDNPRILERDVIRIAAMRPTNPENLIEVFRHPRWVIRYRVKVALACNPYCPIDIALACVPHLMLPQLHYVRTNGKIHKSVREAAKQLLAARRQPPPEPGVLVHRVSNRGTIVREIDGGGLGDQLNLNEIADRLDKWMA